MRFLWTTLALTAPLAVAVERPVSVMHFVSIRWQDQATAQEKEQAMEALAAAASRFPGAVRIWVRPIRPQPQIVSGQPTRLAYSASRPYAGPVTCYFIEFATQQTELAWHESTQRQEWWTKHERLIRRVAIAAQASN